MQSWSFKSLVLCNEINLNAIASHFGITRKFKWEDPLVLSDRKLSGIVRETENKWIYIYYFGTLVFINMEFHEIQDIIKYIKNIEPNLKNNNPTEYIDEYKLEVDAQYDYSLYNDLMTSNEFIPYYLDIISLVLAKSTSLKKIETETDKLLDGIENIINYLDTGKFNMSDQEIAKTSAKVLRFKYNTISYLMLLDKPKAAWDNEDIENFFIQISSLFDLDERYKKINHKTEILQDITDVFASLSHEKRGTKLEIMVIILILFELIISIIEFILKY
ncbi:RMD1 family protein [Clostridium aciditolerans]|uniref:RMD1 family protein n=1 Tax=Clostridium aciditolerans TaxID=339861 RepID=A0A934HZE0_9CLOT|nr:RMD1 family protein [Clostridium aciditolerans]MBI6873190.1 RMD1 family protein [Clostridium aciditolerans]